MYLAEITDCLLILLLNMPNNGNFRMTTNIKTTVYYNGEARFTERYLYPEFREENDRLVEKAVDDDIEPIIVVGKDDRIWWNDDLEFMIDRMQCCDESRFGGWPDGLQEFINKLESNPPAVNEERTFEVGNLKIVAVGDDTPMVNGDIEKIG